jgi:serralysin
MPFAVNPSGNPLIDGVLWGYEWDHLNLLYSFPTTPNDYTYAGGIFGFQPMNSNQVALLTKAIHLWDDVCNITLTKTTTPGAGNIRFGEATQLNYFTADPNDNRWHVPGNPPAPGTAEGNPPDPSQIPDYAQGDVWFNHAFYNSPQPGSFFYAGGLVHEIGHALGLKHGHQTGNAHGVTFPTLPDKYDNQNYSIMTYYSYTSGVFGLKAAEFPTTPMMADVAALQYMYGADYTTRSGNTVYKWNPATGEEYINGHSQGATYHGKILMTLWDGGGQDTYDFSNYHTNVKCNLNPGFWSTPSALQVADLDGSAKVHHAVGSIANALLFNGDTRSMIENANGGTGSDLLIGNFLNNTLKGNAGNDRLYGEAGHDILYGGNGADQFVFQSLSDSTVSSGGRDTIADFRHGDEIVLKDIDANSHVSGNQAFAFHGAFTHHAGEAQFDKLNSNTLLVTLDVNGDGLADAAIIVKGVTTLTKADFIL